MEKYSLFYNVTNADMDTNYKLKPTAVLMYAQDIFARYLTTKRLAAFDVVKENLYWIITEINLEFTNNLPFWSEKIEVKTWISEISKLKIFTEFEIYHNGNIFAKGNICWLLLDINSKRPIKTDRISDKLKILQEYTLGEHQKTTWAEVISNTDEMEYVTNIGDIDFNNHVNNKSYINIASVMLPQEFKENYSLKNLKVKFQKESFLGDKLTCKILKTNIENCYLHKILKSEDEICTIETFWIQQTNKTNISDYKLQLRNH